MQAHPVAHTNHFFAPIERDILFHLRLVTRLPGCYRAVVLSPDDTPDFALRVAHKCRIGVNDFCKELRRARRKDLYSTLRRGLEVVGAAFAKERQYEIRIL